MILSLVVLLRVYQPGCDPPTGLSTSTDVFTDPPQYTLFAKLYVQLGELNPFHDYRLVFFLKSGVTVLSILVYSLLGVSMTSTGLVGVVFAVGALFMFYLFVRKATGPPAALLFLLLAGCNFNLVGYGRLPFLEHPMAFFAFLGLVLAAYGRSAVWHIMAGAALGLGVFFGKVLGVAMLFPFACFYLLRLRQDTERFPQLKLTAAAAFVLGFTLVAGFWYALAYQPFSHQVTGYLQEQSLSLYGAPEGLESIDKFFYKMVTFGADMPLFDRMPIAGLLAGLVIAASVVTATRRTFWTSKQSWLQAGLIVPIAMSIAYFGSLMIWNYRPVRYQLILIYPVTALAAYGLAWMWQRRPDSERWRPSWGASPLLYLLLLIIVYQISATLLTWMNTDWYYNDFRWYLFGGTAVLLALIYWTGRIEMGGVGRPAPWLRRIVVVVCVAANLAISLTYFLSWAPRMTFTARDLSREIGQLVSPEAVLSGPYGPLLSLENGLPAVIHMFGVSSPDPNLFVRFPITHLLVDENNEDRARQDYPDVLDSAVHLGTYRVGDQKLRLFMIAGRTGNAWADAYPPSLMEQAIIASKRGDMAQANRFAVQYAMVNPDNLTCNLFLAEQAEQAGLTDNAEYLFKKAVEFSPTSYVLYARLGQFYADMFATTHSPADRQQGIDAFREAMRLAPEAYKIRADYNALLRQN
jgi:4-amino-4-deoxy-L-arabinose transferase-like glycosyltransferase